MKTFQINLVLVLALLAAACGQSKVEYKKEGVAAGAASSSGDQASSSAQDTSSASSDLTANNGTTADGDDKPTTSTDPVTDEILADNETPEVFDEEEQKAKGVDIIRFRNLREYNIGGERFGWQTWKSPETTSSLLTMEEKVGLGNQVIDEDFATGSAVRKASENGTTLFNLVDHSKARCVFRNRLIESAPLVTKAADVLPPPFGNHRLYCVDFRGGAHSFVQLERTKTWEGDGYWVRWMGTDTKKHVRAKGTSDVEFKLTSRIYAQQGFPKAAYLALSDRMDQLLATVANVSTGQDCTLERVFFLRVRFVDGSPSYAKLYSRTRHFAADDYFNWLDKEQKTLPVGYGQTNFEVPKLNPTAQAACRFQHSAWISCLKSGGKPTKDVACERKVMSVLNLNFADLLNERVKGFASDRIFTLDRSEANGESRTGSLVLWYDLESPVKNPNRLNPLSMEDFQEVTDIIDLKVSK